MENDPLLIGVTGGIGAGKSMICRVFQSLGMPVYNADERAKWLMAHDRVLIEAIKKHFGTDAYLENNIINSAFLASVVFDNEEKRRLLNRLVHPRVGEDFALWVKKNNGFPYLIKEAALLFEAGSYKALDKVINVDAPATLRKRRVLLRDPHREAKDIDAIMASQFSDRQRREMADYTIINDERILVMPQVLKLHEQFLAMTPKQIE